MACFNSVVIDFSATENSSLLTKIFSKSTLSNCKVYFFTADCPFALISVNTDCTVASNEVVSIAGRFKMSFQISLLGYLICSITISFFQLVQLIFLELPQLSVFQLFPKTDFLQLQSEQNSTPYRLMAILLGFSFQAKFYR